MFELIDWYQRLSPELQKILLQSVIYNLSSSSVPYHKARSKYSNRKSFEQSFSGYQYAVTKTREWDIIGPKAFFETLSNAHGISFWAENDALNYYLHIWRLHTLLILEEHTDVNSLIHDWDYDNGGEKHHHPLRNLRTLVIVDNRTVYVGSEPYHYNKLFHALPSLPKLSELTLVNCLTLDNLFQLSGLKGLKSLNIADNFIDSYIKSYQYYDYDIEHVLKIIARMDSLEVLNISGNKLLTNIHELKHLQKLTHLICSDCPIPEHELQELIKANPKLNIEQ